MQHPDIKTIHDFLPPHVCRAAVDAALSLDLPTIGINNYQRYLNSPRYKTPQISEQYNLNDFWVLSKSVVFADVFSPMLKYWNSKTGRDIYWDDKRLRPQIIHYPRGGGFFGVHEHELEPQRLGLIVNLSEKGVDYTEGNTIFYPPRSRAVEPEQRIGTLTTFKYDIPHSVSACDPGGKLELQAPSGRWVAVLPYY